MLVSASNPKSNKCETYVDYTLSDRDSKNNPREGIEVIRGSPQIFTLYDKLPSFYDPDNKRKRPKQYCTAILSFGKKDIVTRQVIEYVLNTFENIVYAGIPQKYRNMLAVMHYKNHDGLHIHLAMLKKIWSDSKAKTLVHNPLKPGWEGKIGDWKNLINLQFGWQDPDDPLIRRLVAKQEGTEEILLKKHEIIDAILQKIADSKIKNHQEIIAFLEANYLEIVNHYKDSITVMETENSNRDQMQNAKKLCLKGRIFRKDWSKEQWDFDKKDRDLLYVTSVFERDLAIEELLKKINIKIRDDAKYNQNRIGIKVPIGEFFIDKFNGYYEPENRITTIARKETNELFHKLQYFQEISNTKKELQQKTQEQKSGLIINIDRSDEDAILKNRRHLQKLFHRLKNRKAINKFLRFYMATGVVLTNEMLRRIQKVNYKHYFNAIKTVVITCKDGAKITIENGTQILASGTKEASAQLLIYIYEKIKPKRFKVVEMDKKLLPLFNNVILKQDDSEKTEQEKQPKKPLDNNRQRLFM